MQDLSIIIEKAISMQDLDPEKLSRLLDVQERLVDKESEHAYMRSMSECQREMPTIAKDAENLQTGSKYAKLENIIVSCKPIYTKHGFSVEFYEGKADSDGCVKICCDVMHSGGYKKTSSIELPIDDKGIKGTTNKTQIHAHVSTVSYGRRTLFCSVFNIAIANQDDDAVNSTHLIEMCMAVRENFEAISQIKDGIANGDPLQVASYWFDLDDDQKSLLWRAPSKGGIFTTQERSYFKSNDFFAARQEILKS